MTFVFCPFCVMYAHQYHLICRLRGAILHLAFLTLLHLLNPVATLYFIPFYLVHPKMLLSGLFLFFTTLNYFCLNHGD